VVPDYETYALDNSSADYKEISKKNIYPIANAAVAQAAHDALVALVPASAASAGALLTTSLAEIEESELKARGIQIGKDAAQAVLAERLSDPPLRFAAYQQGTEPGEYRSTPPYSIANPPVWPANAAYAPYMETFKPFGIETSDQFRAQPPYPLDSPEYAADYNEVKRLGGETSMERTQEQKDLGIFYLNNIPNAINRLAKIFAVSEELNGWETARLLALTHMTQFDALLSSFESNYYYNRWRPVTAIRLGDSDGNDETAGDPTWSSVVAARANPPTPAYPSTYSAMAKAGAELLSLFSKKDEFSFTTISFYVPGVEKSYTRFSDYASDVSISRLYVGFQFRHDMEEGERMGKEVAKYVFAHKLRRL
jgi:hypothetical protein